METTELANELRNILMRLAHINDCFLLHKKLLTYTTEMNTEMNIAPAFFQIVMYSLEHTYMVDLFKLYDRDRSSKGLRKVINLCEQHSTIFPKERILFRDTERNHNEVVKINIIKDIKEIREKLDLIDPVVNSLKGRRDNYYAHTDKAYVDDLPQLASNYPLSFKQVADLIQTANEILNTLLRDLCGEVVAQSSTNYDDVKNIFVVLVYKCGQKKLNNLYYQMKEQRRCSAWRKTKNPTLRNSSSRSWICTMPEELRIHNWNVNMA